MLFRSNAHPGKAVRLGYCMNLHAAETLDELLANMQRITLPLRERLAPKSEFGVGMYLPANLARELANDATQLARLKRFLDEHALDPFTYNAFPFGDFGRAGLKARVFQPTWAEPARLAYTADVAETAVQLASGFHSDRHISISTHSGAHSSHLAFDEKHKLENRCLAGYLDAAAALAELEKKTDRLVVLSLEAEPRALAQTIDEVLGLIEFAPVPRSRRDLTTSPRTRHLGTCFDACHAAVEFEDARMSVLKSQRFGAGIGKIQFTSAIAVLDPANNERGRNALFALDEPHFLHQVTGQSPDVVARVGDIVELVSAWNSGGHAWRDCAEWRCHFHVPVDLGELSASGLSTTRAYADEVLGLALLDPESWKRPELHVEIETYTWDVLPRAARGAGELVDGLEREYRHVLGVLENAGWKHAHS